MRSLRSAFAASLLLSLAGCFDLDLSNTTDGDDDELSFGLEGNEFLECLFGCPIDRGFVVGTVGRVRIFDSDPDERISVRLASAKSGSVTLVESFSCAAEDGSSRAVQFRERCRPGETHNVVRGADIVATRAGGLDLEVLDADGDVIDALSLLAEMPTTIAVIGSSGQIIGRFPGTERLPVAPSSTTEIELAFEDEDGELLYFSDFVTGLVSDDPGVASVTTAASLLQFGPAPFEVTTGEAGATNLSIDLAGTRFDIPVDLTPAQ
jgi:hypothetical protein